MTAIKQASEKEQHEQVREMIAQAHSKLAEQEQAEHRSTQRQSAHRRLHFVIINLSWTL
jgi:epoxyqueuosine reductase